MAHFLDHKNSGKYHFHRNTPLLFADTPLWCGVSVVTRGCCGETSNDTCVSVESRWVQDRARYLRDSRADVVGVGEWWCGAGWGSYSTGGHAGHRYNQATHCNQHDTISGALIHRPYQVCTLGILQCARAGPDPLPV